MKGKIPDDFELGCFNMPIAEPTKGEPSAVSTKVEPFFVMSKSPHPEEAVDFLRFITSRRLAGKFAQMQDIPTAVRGANEGNLSKDLDDLNRIVNGAKVNYGFIPGAEMEDVYNDMMS